VMKQAQGTTETLRRLSTYSKKQAEYHRQSQQHKLNL